MKKVQVSLIYALVLGAVLAFSGCANSGNTNAEGAEVSAETTEAEMEDPQSGPEWTSAYICPMHCKGSGSETEGNCPVCGMAYVANPDLESADAEGQESGGGSGHDGHQH